jgi:hypothetical protein
MWKTFKANLGHNRKPKFDHLKFLSVTLALYLVVNSGANPTIASYNASVVKIYSAVNSMARF